MKHVIYRDEKKFEPITLSLTFESKEEADFTIGLLGRMSLDNAIAYYEGSHHGKQNILSRDQIRESFEALIANIRRPLIQLLDRD